MNEASKQPERPFEILRGVAAVIMWLTQMLSIPSEMLLHEGVGERYLGISGGLAALLMMFFAVVMVRSNPALLWLLLVIFVIRRIVHRVRCARLRWLGGTRQRARHPGRPIVCRLRPAWPEATVKWPEPPAIMLLGLVTLSAVSGALGIYWVASGAALLLCGIIRANYAYNKMLDLHDATLEQQVVAEKFRDLSGR